MNEYNSLNMPNNILVHDNALPLNETHRTHYTNIYKNKNLEIKHFFKRNDLPHSSRLINVNLENPLKWEKLKTYFNINSIPTEDVWVGANHNK